MIKNHILIEDIIKVKLLMVYDNRKTYSENLFLEQTAYERYLDRTFEDPKKAQEYLDANSKVMKGLYNWFSTFDTHDWLSLIEISSGLLGLIPTPLSPLFLGISLAAGLSDAGLYFDEGDPYMGTMMAALALIPGGELLVVLKGSKVLKKRGTKGCVELIKKYKKGVKLTTEELDDLTKLGVSISKNADEVKRLLKINITKNMVKTLGTKSTKYLMNLLLVLKKIGVIKLGDIALKVGGVTYGFDKLYLYVFRDSIFADKELLDKRTTNDLRYLINKLLGYDKEVQEYLLLKTKEALQKVIDNPNTQENIVDIKIDESKDTNAIKEFLNIINLESKKYQESLVAPSIDEILTGKKIVKLNQKGNSVKEIQKMLYDLEYDHLITNFETQENWNDGIYGNNTKNAVETFQEDNGLNVDGIVGKNTLLKIKELYNNKNKVKNSNDEQK
jgi:hypothetical protein